MSDVAILMCSPSYNSKTAKVGNYVATALQAMSIDAVPINLRELPAEPLLLGDVAHPEIAAAANAVLGADGVVIATPVFKAAYSGLLKVFLDLLPQYALAGKVVLPLATGGSMAHVLALDYALRPVLQSMNPLTVLPSLFLLDKTLIKQNGVDLQVEALTALNKSIHDFADAVSVSGLWAPQRERCIA